MNPLNLSATWRDYWGMYNPPAVAQVSPLDNLACFRPRWLLLPDAKSEIVPASGKIDYNFFVKPGSIIWGLRTSAVVASAPPIGLSPDPPVPIPPDRLYGLPGGGGDSFVGPYSFGGRLYAVLGGENASAGIVSVFMSTDGGFTWAVQNAAGQPTVNNEYAVAAALVGSVLQVALGTAGGDVEVKTFDCATNLWGATSAAAGVANATGGLAITVQPDGRRFVFYVSSSSGFPSHNHLVLLVLSAGGVWSAPVTLLTSPGDFTASILGVRLDAAGISHLFYFTASNATNAQIQIGYIQVSATPAILLSEIISTLDPTVDETSTNVAMGYSPTLSGGTFAIPVPYDIGAVVPQLTPQVVIGNAATGFFLTSPDPTRSTVPAGATSACLQAIAVTADGFFVAFWVVLNTTTGLTDSLWMATWNGSRWNSPVLVYDAVADPPAGGFPTGPSASMSSVMAALLPSGAIGLLFQFPAFGVPFPPSVPAYFTSLLALPFGGAVFQLSDIELKHDLFQDPMNVEFMDSSGTPDTFPGYSMLPAPHPVTGEGLFRFQAWAPPGTRIAFRLMIAEASSEFLS